MRKYLPDESFRNFLSADERFFEQIEKVRTFQ